MFSTFVLMPSVYTLRRMGGTEVQHMSSVKENIRKIKVLAALIGGNILKNN